MIHGSFSATSWKSIAFRRRICLGMNNAIFCEMEYGVIIFVNIRRGTYLFQRSAGISQLGKKVLDRSTRLWRGYRSVNIFMACWSRRKIPSDFPSNFRKLALLKKESRVKPPVSSQCVSRPPEIAPRVHEFSQSDSRIEWTGPAWRTINTVKR